MTKKNSVPLTKEEVKETMRTQATQYTKLGIKPFGFALESDSGDVRTNLFPVSSDPGADYLELDNMADVSGRAFKAWVNIAWWNSLQG